MIARQAIREFLDLTRKDKLSTSLFEIVDIDHDYPIPRIHQILNQIS